TAALRLTSSLVVRWLGVDDRQAEEPPNRLAGALRVGPPSRVLADLLPVLRVGQNLMGAVSADSPPQRRHRAVVFVGGQDEQARRNDRGDAYAVGRSGWRPKAVGHVHHVAQRVEAHRGGISSSASVFENPISSRSRSSLNISSLWSRPKRSGCASMCDSS